MHWEALGSDEPMTEEAEAVGGREWSLEKKVVPFLGSRPRMVQALTPYPNPLLYV